VDYSRTNGLVEEIRQAIRQQREEQERELLSLERAPPPHRPAAPLELPPGPLGASGGAAAGPSVSATTTLAPDVNGSTSVSTTAPMAVPIRLPLLRGPAAPPPR
jgi:hypothetical protein